MFLKELMESCMAEDVVSFFLMDEQGYYIINTWGVCDLGEHLGLNVPIYKVL